MKLRFAFHPDDRERYGDGEWTFDPEVLLRQPTRMLIAIESTVGMGIPAVLARLDRPADRRYTEALLAATWIARRLAGVDESYDSYEPLVYLMDLQIGAGDVDPPSSTSSPTPVSAEA